MTPRTGDDAGLRAKLVDEYADIMHNFPDNPQVLRLVDCGIAAVRSWDEANVGSVPVAGWVAITDQAPPTDVYVLVWSPEREMAFQCLWRGGFPQILNRPNERASMEITHWMPMPPAPGEAAAPVQGTRPMEGLRLPLSVRQIGGEVWIIEDADHKPVNLGTEQGQRELVRLANAAHSEPQPAPVVAAGPRDLAGDIVEAGTRYWSTFIDGTSESEYIVTELTRLGWVHSSQATGGGLSGEARETIRKTLRIYNTQLNTIRHLSDEAPRGMDAIECALAELAALPVRGDGRGVGT